jgi:hypothetical protein
MLPKSFITGCPQCEALMINGLFCHEHGCPQLRVDAGRTCPECGTLCADRSEAVACCAPDYEPLDGPDRVRHE